MFFNLQNSNSVNLCLLKVWVPELNVYIFYFFVAFTVRVFLKTFQYFSMGLKINVIFVFFFWENKHTHTRTHKVIFSTTKIIKYVQRIIA